MTETREFCGFKPACVGFLAGTGQINDQGVCSVLDMCNNRIQAARRRTIGRALLSRCVAKNHWVVAQQPKPPQSYVPLLCGHNREIVVTIFTVCKQINASKVKSGEHHLQSLVFRGSSNNPSREIAHKTTRISSTKSSIHRSDTGVLSSNLQRSIIQDLSHDHQLLSSQCLQLRDSLTG